MLQNPLTLIGGWRGSASHDLPMAIRDLSPLTYFKEVHLLPRVIAVVILFFLNPINQARLPPIYEPRWTDRSSGQ
jgi:hypothetical protein